MKMIKNILKPVAIMTVMSNSICAQVNQEFEINKVRTFGGAGMELTSDMALDSDGNQFLFGRFRGDFHDSTSISYDANGVDQGFLQKSDINGNILWTKLITSSSTNPISPKKVGTDSQENTYVYFSGPRNTTTIDPGGENISLTYPNTFSTRDLFLWKINENGNTVWVKSFGGIGLNNATSMVIDNEDNIILTGNFEQTLNLDPNQGPVLDSLSNPNWLHTTSCAGNGCYDGFIVKIDSSGAALWSHQIGGTQDDDVTCVTVDINNNIILGGKGVGLNFNFPGAPTLNGGLNFVGYLGKLDENGNGLGINFVDGGGNDEINNLVTDNQGNIYASVLSSSFQLILNSSPSVTYSNLNSGTNDAILIKYDPNLNYDWHHAVSSSANDRIGEIYIHPNSQKILFTGAVAASTTQQGNTFTHFGGGADMYLCQLDNNGNEDKFSYIGGTGIDFGQDIKIHSDGTIILYGEIESNVQFDINDTITTIGNAGNRDVFIAYGYDCDDFNINPTISLSANNDSIVCNLVGNYDYTWYYEDSTSNTTVLLTNTDNYISGMTLEGTYSVIVSNTHCTSNSSNSVNYTLSNTGIGIEEESKTIKSIIYPNPVEDNLFLSLSENLDKITLEIYDLSGKIVFSNSYVNQNLIEVKTNITKGTYLLKIKSQGFNDTKLFVKE